MRTLVLSLLLSLVVVASAQAQNDPYQWVGLTSVDFTGDGNGLGFVGMTTQCRADYGAGARMCSSVEILQSDNLNPNAIPPEDCWVRASIAGFATGGSINFYAIDASGAFASASGLTCGQWGADTSPTAGNGLVLSDDGRFRTALCSESRPAACCKPTPVGEPISSLTIPIGAGALAGLSMLKGGG
jgi:hypothetical protein